MSAEKIRYGGVCSKQRVTAFLLLLVLFLFRSAHASGIKLPQTSIQPLGVVEFSQGQPIQVQVRVSEPTGIMMVRCYFRYQPQDDLLFIELTNGNDDLYYGLLPAPASAVNEIEIQYVVVNTSRQVIRSQPYAVGSQGEGRQDAAPESAISASQVKAELITVAREGDQFFDPERVKIEIVPAKERFGLAAGLYTPGNFAGLSTLEGYFGGFLLQDDGRLLPVKGLMLTPLKIPGADSGSNELQAASPSVQAANDIVGPDIAGDTWSGLCYYGWGESVGELFITDPTPITAQVTHEGNDVTITISQPCNIFGEIIGPYFEGAIDWSGNMLLLDQRIPVQTWSTHWGPATETEILIGDYVSPPTPEEPYADYYVIQLARDLTPPPPPEPEVPLFLPALYMLLMPHEAP